MGVVSSLRASKTFVFVNIKDICHIFNIAGRWLYEILGWKGFLVYIPRPGDFERDSYYQIGQQDPWKMWILNSLSSSKTIYML